MSLLLRTAAIAGALALSTAAFAQANQEGNKPENNAAATAPLVKVAYYYHHHYYAHHPYYRASHMRSPGEQRMGNGSNGSNPNNGVSGNTSGMGNSQSNNPQSNY